MRTKISSTKKVTYLTFYAFYSFYAFYTCEITPITSFTILLFWRDLTSSVSGWHLLFQSQQQKNKNNVWNLSNLIKYQNGVADVVLVFLLFILSRYYTLVRCFYCWLWISKCRLGCGYFIWWFRNLLKDFVKE